MTQIIPTIFPRTSYPGPSTIITPKTNHIYLHWISCDLIIRCNLISKILVKKSPSSRSDRKMERKRIKQTIKWNKTRTLSFGEFFFEELSSVSLISSGHIDQLLKINWETIQILEEGNPKDIKLLKLIY